MSSVIYDGEDPCSGWNGTAAEGPTCEPGMAYDSAYSTCYAVVDTATGDLQFRVTIQNIEQTTGVQSGLESCPTPATQILLKCSGEDMGVPCCNVGVTQPCVALRFTI